MMESLGLISIIFSRDRAMQLDATLRSLFLHCQDMSEYPLFILYQASGPIHLSQYEQLVADYKNYLNLQFLSQSNFRRDLLSLLATPRKKGFRDFLYHRLIQWNHRFGSIAARFYEPVPNRLVFFIVDDNIFVENFCIKEIIHSIQDNPDAIGFSLRLGQNTTYCYMRDQQQRLPRFAQLTDRIWEYEWMNCEFDFGYPLEVSSSVLRIEDILPQLIRLPFHNPNTLESRLATLTPTFQFTRPKLLCYEKSVTFCNPINKTQTGYRNRSGNILENSIDHLAKEFAAGYRIKVDAYSGLVPKSCHQEVNLVFEQKKSSSL